MAYYDELQPVPNTDNEAVIFRIANSTKGTWYVRVKRHNANGYFKKTLKTTNIFEALKRANMYWMQVRDAESREIVLAPTNNFKTLFPKYMEARSKRSTKYVCDSVRRQFEMYYLDYFGNRNVGTITEGDYIRYLNTHRLDLSKHPSARKKPTLRTLVVEQTNLLSFLKWCYHNEKTRRPPSIGKLDKNTGWIVDGSLLDTSKLERRDTVSTTTYAHIREYFRHHRVLRPRDNREPKSVEFSRRRMHFYLISIYNFVCRPGEELLNLKFSDFTLCQSDLKETAYYMQMRTPYGKKNTKKKRVTFKDGTLVYFSTYDYPKYFSDWMEVLRQHGYPTGPNDYVFPVRKYDGNSDYHNGYAHYDKYDGEYIPWRSSNAASMLRRSRKHIKAYLTSLEDRDGKRRLTERISVEIDNFSPYSVRHLAIRNLIVDSNYSMTRAAERANTGLNMIRDYYYRYGIDPEGRVVSKHPEPSVANTKSTKDDVVNNLANSVRLQDARSRGKRNYS